MKKLFHNKRDIILER